MRAFLTFVLTILFVFSVVGQTPTPTTPVTINEEIKRATEVHPNEAEINEKKRKEMLRLRWERVKELVPFLEEIFQTFPAPPEYFAKYSSFLKNKDTGLIRIFPDNGCGKDVKSVVSIDELEKCSSRPQIAGAGSLYSFRFPALIREALQKNFSVPLVNSLINESDIQFINGNLIVGKNLTQNIIVEIGDVSLETVSAKSETFRFLEKWEQVHNKKQLAAQNQILEKGVQNNGYIYANKAIVKNNSAYLLRSIAYSEKSLTFWNTDQTVVFKIVGQEVDRSIIILWKKLKEKSAAKLDS